MAIPHVRRFGRSAVAFTAIVLAAVGDAPADQFGLFSYKTYTEAGETKVEITHYPRDEVGAITIPATIDGHPVERIDWGAFEDCRHLTDVTIPEGVTEIPGHAFRSCHRLRSVSIPSTVTSIQHQAFSYCISLRSVFIPEGVTTIGVHAFQDCASLTALSLPSTLTNIDARAFWRCTHLGEVTFPQSVTAIDDKAFALCADPLTVRFLGDAPESIGREIFGDGTVSVLFSKHNAGFTSPEWNGYPAAPFDLDPDEDGDGLLDEWEQQHFGNTEPTPTDDPDADGLDNRREFLAGTDPRSPDTDNDNLGDAEEVDTHGTDPLAADSDGDQITDDVELAVGTDPNDSRSHPPPRIGPVPMLVGAVGLSFQFVVPTEFLPTSIGANGLPEGLLIDTASGRIHGTPLHTGVFQLEFAALNSAGVTTTRTTLEIVDSFASWLEKNGITTPGDTDADGTHDLLEFALQTDPNTLDTDRLPRLTTIAAGGLRSFIYTFELQSPLSPELSVAVETSADGSTWNEVARRTGQSAWGGPAVIAGILSQRRTTGGRTEVSLIQTTPAGTAAHNLYRLRITR